MKPAPRQQDLWSLAGAPIVVTPTAHETIRFAALELSRYLYLLTGCRSPLIAQLPAKTVSLVVDPEVVRAMGLPADAGTLGDQGYHLRAARQARGRQVVIVAVQPVGVLYGVYGLLERLGMGFYAGGETFPELPAAAEIDADLDETAAPAFRVRGNMLHYNFLCGCTNWGLADYRFYFDQLARMRCNMLLMHWYDGEPGAAYEWRGEYLTGGVTPNSLTRPWGALAALRTSEFSFGTGRCFDAEIYSSPMGEDQPDLLTEIKRTEAVFSEATRYARVAGIEIAAGFEAPRADPQDVAVQDRFKARLEQFVARNPFITRLALWEHESGGCVGTPPPPAGTPGAALLARRRAEFAYLGNEQRVWEAVRFGRFAELAATTLAKVAPHLRLVLVGWGGDRWMQFADYCLGYDRLLPPDVAFTCHDNIDASMGPNVSTPWGQLPARRERWAMPWVEGDIDECAVRQPQVESLGRLAPDALRKGCQGLLTLQWRTRDVEEETGFIAQFAWNPKLTPDRFYRRLARHAFGATQEARMARHLATLQRLGSRWTGVRGTVECGAMRWTGWVPHFPFEVTGAAAAFLAAKAEAAATALAEVPAGADGEAAFHLLPQDQGSTGEQQATRPGVAELTGAATRLHALEREDDPARLRAEFAAIEETVYAVRPQLVALGMTSRSYQAVDGFLIAIHHLWRNAGATEHLATLRAIRRDLDRLAAAYRRTYREARLERLDYLAATMDFVMPYDAVAMLLADGERVPQALAEVARLKQAGDVRQATNVAARAYTEVVAAGMAQAVQALARKLTTRCDFGTLTTFNVKQLPLYWQTLGQLEEFLPAVPPREVTARGQFQEVWLSWTPGPRTAQQVVWRRPPDTNDWRAVTSTPLAGTCRMFVDRPPRPGAYEYAISALAADGWESPMSHPALAVRGLGRTQVRIVAAKPPGRSFVGEDLEQRVVVLADRGVGAVVLHWRPVGTSDWRYTMLRHAFREAYVGVVSALDLGPGVVEFYVEAEDNEGNSAVWPETAPECPWTTVVLG